MKLQEAISKITLTGNNSELAQKSQLVERAIHTVPYIVIRKKPEGRKA